VTGNDSLTSRERVLGRKSGQSAATQASSINANPNCAIRNIRLLLQLPERSPLRQITHKRYNPSTPKTLPDFSSLVVVDAIGFGGRVCAFDSVNPIVMTRPGLLAIMALITD